MTSITNDQPLLDLLERYRSSIINNNLTWKQRLLLLELNVKDTLLTSGKEIPNSEEERLKYMFFGLYFYEFLLPAATK